MPTATTAVNASSGTATVSGGGLSDRDLDDYLARIGYAGERTPTLATLTALHRLHPQSIPFENLDPLRHSPVSLDPAVVHDKLVRGQRGGYCFEQNGLFRRVLEKLGFKVASLVARVMWFVPPGTLTQRSHMVLRVDVEGRSYLADVGFGGLVLTAPLWLDTDAEQATPHETFRLVREGGEIHVQAGIGDEWLALYRFDLAEQMTIDYDAPNWYACTHPASRFTNDLIAARAPEGARYTMLNNQLTIRTADHHKTKRLLRTADELRGALREYFGIAVPQDEAMDAALRRLAAREPAQ